jgi:hypothetical protein
MHVMLSVPMPSEAAMFTGQILSIIISTILAKPTPPMLEVEFLDEGDSFFDGLFFPEIVVAPPFLAFTEEVLVDAEPLLLL